MAVEAATSELVKVVALLGAAVVMVPLFRRAGLGSVLGYFAAGLAIGPFGLGWFSDPQAILHTAELGVVMFLFVIGLEMRPSHLWSLRKEIFGLGTLQIVTCALVLTSIAKLFGLPWQVAFIGATGFVLTSTAVVMQLLAERGDIALPSGQKIVSILLFEDLLIVPLLALVAWMGPGAGSADGEGSRWLSVAIGVGAIVGLVLVGRFLLNPLFRVLAESKAREVMTAAALLVVLGAALLMQLGGLSMAMGAFLAGVLLSESTFRHQIEADIEPFRGILLGLFFLSVGMALDLGVVVGNWPMILGLVVALMAAKALCIYVVARLMGSDHAQALDRGVLMAQGGEFAFVLFAAAAAEVTPVTSISAASEMGRAILSEARMLQNDNAEIDYTWVANMSLKYQGCYHTQVWNGNAVLFRPPLDLRWKVTGGRWVSAEREYVYADNDWTRYLPSLRVLEVPGDHDSMVLEPNVRVLAGLMRDCIEAARQPEARP